MASVEAAVIAALKASPSVNALVGTSIAIWGGKQSSSPLYVTVQRISTEGAGHLDGPSNLDWPRIQIDVWGTDGLSALNVAEAIRTAIDAVPQTSLGVEFSATFQDQRGPAPDEETRNFRVSSDFLVFYERN